jgi:hypothetical protein
VQQGERAVSGADAYGSTNRHQEVVPMMAERQIAYDRDIAGGEEFVKQRLDFGVTAAPFQLPNDHCSDFLQSTGKP